MTTSPTTNYQLTKTKLLPVWQPYNYKPPPRRGWIRQVNKNQRWQYKEKTKPTNTRTVWCNYHEDWINKREVPWHDTQTTTLSDNNETTTTYQFLRNAIGYDKTVKQHVITRYDLTTTVADRTVETKTPTNDTDNMTNDNSTDHNKTMHHNPSVNRITQNTYQFLRNAIGYDKTVKQHVITRYDLTTTVADRTVETKTPTNDTDNMTNDNSTDHNKTMHHNPSVNRITQNTNNVKLHLRTDHVRDIQTEP
jgi:hypothetical protein